MSVFERVTGLFGRKTSVAPAPPSRDPDWLTNALAARVAELDGPPLAPAAAEIPVAPPRVDRRQSGQPAPAKSEAEPELPLNLPGDHLAGPLSTDAGKPGPAPAPSPKSELVTARIELHPDLLASPPAATAAAKAPPRAAESQSFMEEPRSGEGLLSVHGVWKSYKGRSVVRGVSLDLQRGEAVGLLGPNGAGKTTVFYMITGLVEADKGHIELDGHDITALPMYRRARLGIGYLPQEASIFRGLNVEDNIRAVLEVTEKDKAKRERDLDELLDEFSITRLRKSPAIALSGGERRRLEIARALATRPSFMLLDEPFAGIDPIAVGDIQNLVRHLKERGIGVLITDHNVRETLGLIDRAYIIHSGQVLMEGTPDEIVSNPDVRRLYLGEEFRL